MARATGQRLTAHPSEFVKLAAPRPELVEESLADLELHGSVRFGPLVCIILSSTCSRRLWSQPHVPLAAPQEFVCCFRAAASIVCYKVKVVTMTVSRARLWLRGQCMASDTNWLRWLVHLVDQLMIGSDAPQVFDLMGYEPSHWNKVNIHIGGVCSQCSLHIAHVTALHISSAVSALYAETEHTGSRLLVMTQVRTATNKPPWSGSQSEHLIWSPCIVSVHTNCVAGGT